MLITETYKIINRISPPIMENFLILPENMYNVRNFQEISNENLKTVNYGMETTSHRTQFLWANLSNEYKLAISN